MRVAFLGLGIMGRSMAANLVKAGGKAETLQQLQPLFTAMGKTVMHMGDVSMGQSAKLAMNLMIALIYQGFAEALVLSRKLGVQPETLLGLIQASMVRSGVVDYKGPFVLRHDFSPNFPLRLMYKDMQLMMDAARQNRVKLPGLETVKEIYELAIEEGQENLDYAATLTLLERWAGLASSFCVPSLRDWVANLFQPSTDVLGYRDSVALRLGCVVA